MDSALRYKLIILIHIKASHSFQVSLNFFKVFENNVQLSVIKQENQWLLFQQVLSSRYALMLKKCAVAFQPNKSGGTRDLKQLCADDEQSRTCWMTAIRLLKVIFLCGVNLLLKFTMCNSDLVNQRSNIIPGSHAIAVSILYNES